MAENIWLIALEKVKQHPGTSGSGALAKAILSFYNPNHAFSMGDILSSLDHEYSAIAIRMTAEYAAHGETPELRVAGEEIYKTFPRLIELSEAMYEARQSVRSEWDRQREREREAMSHDD